MIFYPKSYFNKIVDIDVNFFIEKNIKAVLLDIDNTILDKRHNMVQGLEDWVKTLKENDIKICILSNTNKKRKHKICQISWMCHLYILQKNH